MYLLLRPDIGKEYLALCSSQLPFMDFLFGDDPEKHLKEIGDQNKIGAKISPNYRGQHPSQGRPGYNSYKKSNNWGEATTPNFGNTKVMPTGTTRAPGQANGALTSSH